MLDSYRNSPDWRTARPGRMSTSASSVTVSRSAKGTSLPMTAADCSRRLCSGESRSMRAARTASTVSGTRIPSTSQRPPAGTARPDEDSRLHEGAHALLDEERIALGSVDQVLPEGNQAGIGPRPASRTVSPRSTATAGRGGSWRVTGPVRPRMLILGPIRHEKHDPRRRQGVDQRIQQCLRLGIDPLHVVHHHDHGTALTFSKQQKPDGIEGPLAPLRGVQGEPPAVVDRHVEQCQQRRSYREQRLVDRDQRVRHPPGRGRWVVPILDPRSTSATDS